MKKYKVTLTDEERQQLSSLIATGKAAARKLAHARVLLHADAAPGGPAWTDQRIEEGQDWEQEIEEALDRATVAVLLISQRFLASDFVTEKEIPKILQREVVHGQVELGAGAGASLILITNASAEPPP